MLFRQIPVGMGPKLGCDGSHPFRTGTLQPNGHEPKDQQELNVVAIWLYGCVRKWSIPPTWIDLATLKGKMMISLW